MKSLSKKQKKKKPSRSSVKNPALKKHYNSKIRQEYLDYDYLDKLSEKEKEWLNNFTEEFNNANFTHNGKKIDKTKKGRKASYDRNNARNRCIYSAAKAKGMLIDNTDIQGIMEANQDTSFTQEDLLAELEARRNELMDDEFE